MSDTYHQ